MQFKIGDYATGRGVVFHLTDEFSRDVINANSENFRKSTQEEIENYHESYGGVS
ncbi:hypothetical protein ACFSMW_13415 [Virgibacillus halophilus]|uniref:Uncharacterized protein n=1 Tax=Tigheibacillus halophilus TaxID=361280 RepID=A0ABU5C7U0_9BACI|nr:hypothetical protein [Virgibacillus halophilus]